jgi:hypothetical protein
MTPLRSHTARLFGFLGAAVVVTALPASAADRAPDPPREDAPPHSPPFSRLWVGVAGALDFVHLPAGSDVCRLGQSSGPHYDCVAPGGSDFPTPTENANLGGSGNAGQVDGGFQPGDVRVMLAADYAITVNLLAGVRLGYVLNAYPGEAAVAAGRALGFKVHAEARGTYVFGRAPLAHEGFAPLVFVGGGVSQFDGHSTSAIAFDHIAGELPVVAWLTDAPFFFVVGAGLRYQFSSHVAATFAARFNGAIGGNGFLPTYGPEITIQYGLF